MSDKAQGEPDRLNMIDRAVQILRVFRPGESSLPLREIADRTGLPKSSVHRLAHALAEHNLMISDGNGNYALGVGLWELGSRAIHTRLPIKEIEPYARRIADHCGETCHVGILDGLSAVYVVRVAGSHAVAVQTYLGQRVPAYCTATGKALLAWQPEEVLKSVLAEPLHKFTTNTPTSAEAVRAELELTRQRGYSINIGAWQTDLCGTSVPILNRKGEAVAAIGIAGPLYRFDEARLHEAAGYIRGIAEEISRLWGQAIDMKH